MTAHALPLDDGSEPDWDALVDGVASPVAADDADPDQGKLPVRNLVGAVDTFSPQERTRWQEAEDDEWQSRLDEQQWLEDQGR